MIYLTIANTLAIIYLIVCKKPNLYWEFEKEKTFFDKTVVGYRLNLWVKAPKHSNYSGRRIFSFYFPIKNKKKIELEEEISRMIAKNDKAYNKYKLTQIFTLLKTCDEVNEFEKNYTVVDQKHVESLVSNFKSKINK